MQVAVQRTQIDPGCAAGPDRLQDPILLPPFQTGFTAPVKLLQQAMRAHAPTIGDRLSGIANAQP